MLGSRLISYLVGNVLSDLLNLGGHEHGQNRLNKSHTQWITGSVDYIYRFVKLGNIKFNV